MIFGLRRKKIIKILDELTKKLVTMPNSCKQFAISTEYVESVLDEEKKKYENR